MKTPLSPTRSGIVFHFQPFGQRASCYRPFSARRVLSFVTQDGNVLIAPRSFLSCRWRCGFAGRTHAGGADFGNLSGGGFSNALSAGRATKSVLVQLSELQPGVMVKIRFAIRKQHAIDRDIFCQATTSGSAAIRVHW